MSAFKVLEYICCVVGEEREIGRFNARSYNVRERDSLQSGILICTWRELELGEEIVCKVGDANETGNNMILIVDYDVLDRFRKKQVAESDLEELNKLQDVRVADLREKLRASEEQRQEKKRSRLQKNAAAQEASDN